MPRIAAKSVLAANNNSLPDFWDFFCVRTYAVQRSNPFLYQGVGLRNGQPQGLPLQGSTECRGRSCACPLKILGTEKSSVSQMSTRPSNLR